MQPGEGPEAYHWITLRAGTNSAGTTTFNGSAGARTLGGRMASHVIAQEIMT